MTLLELLLALGILMGVGLVYALVLTSALDAWEAGTARAGTDQEARLTLERFSREVRASRRGAGGAAVVGPTEVVFPLDKDNDGAYETSVRYYLDGILLRRQENGAPNPGDPLAGNVSAVAFSDPLGGGRMITVSLALSPPTLGEKGSGDTFMRTAAGPRNE